MYENILTDVYSIFASSGWTSTGYNAYPANYSGTVDTSKPFLKVSVLPARGTFDTYSLGKKTEGLVILSIFVDSAEGSLKLMQIADILDSLFQGKTLTNGTQIGSSYFRELGLDPADNTLFRGDYSINFIAYGE